MNKGAVIARITTTLKAVPEEGETVSDLLNRIREKRPELEILDVKNDGVVLKCYDTGLTVGDTNGC